LALVKRNELRMSKGLIKSANIPSEAKEAAEAAEKVRPAACAEWPGAKAP